MIADNYIPFRNSIYYHVPKGIKLIVFTPLYDDKAGLRAGVNEVNQSEFVYQKNFIQKP